MKIAFITAMPEEFRAVIRLLDTPATVRIGRYKTCSGIASGHDMVAIESGMGFDNAAEATETLIREVHPEIIISAGFCGGIEPDLGVGDLVVATQLFVVSGDAVKEVPVDIADAGHNFIVRQSMPAQRVFGGAFISTPVIMEKARIAAMLSTDVPHPVVEMESAAIALIATENGIPFVGIRSVSDPADEELSFSLDEFCDDQKRIRIPLVLLSIMRKPGIIPQLLRLARNSRIAGASLAQAVEEFLAFV